MRRLLSEILYFLKRTEFFKNKIKFLVFTGTAGKTLMRDAIFHCLKQLGFKIESMPWGYTNEVGIILSALGIEKFSFWNIISWHRFFKMKINNEKLVCIELGADFRDDINWFLNKFRPHSVFITGLSQKAWARSLDEILSEKQKLIESILPNGWFFCNIDNPLIKSLLLKSKASASFERISLSEKDVEIYLNEWSQNFYNLPVEEWRKNKEYISLIVHGKKIEIYFSQPLFEPQIFALATALGFIDRFTNGRLGYEELQKLFENYSFPEKRLQISFAKNGALIVDDSYKSTPYCLNYCLQVFKKIKAKRKIFILTELYPSPKNKEEFYSSIGGKLEFANQIYFLGHQNSFNLLKRSNSNIKKINEINFKKIAQEILPSSSSGDIIFLKGSYYYPLQKFKSFLL